METLDRYGAATGQRLNLEKIAINFRAKVISGIHQALKWITGILKDEGTSNYLGATWIFQWIENIVDFSMKECLDFFQNCCRKGERGIDKAVAMAMHVYDMSYVINW